MIMLGVRCPGCIQEYSHFHTLAGSVTCKRTVLAEKLQCEEVWWEVSNYIDGTVAVSLKRRMDEHFAECRRCRAVLDGTRNVVRLARRSQRLPATRRYG